MTIERVGRTKVSIAAFTLAIGAATPSRAVLADTGEPKSKPILVLESHVGDRPAQIGLLITKVDGLLEAHGFAARPDTIMRIAGPSAPRPGILDASLTPALIAQDLNDGFSLFGEGHCDAAVPALTKGLDEVRRNPALVVNDTGNLDLTFKDYIALAVCFQKQKNAGGALRTITDAIRIFPSRPVSRQEAWGREGEQLYIDGTRLLHPMGRGRLSIFADNPEAAIFVENQLRGMGTASLADLVPGVYHVFVRLPGTMGRQYEIEVSPNDEARLDVKPGADNSVWMSDSWVGCQFASESARGNEVKCAGDLSRRWTNGHDVAILTPGTENGRSGLAGILYRDDRIVRHGFIFTDVPDPDGPESLTRLLSGERVPDSAGFKALKNDDAEGVQIDTIGEHRWLRTSNVVLSTGLVLVVGSGIAYALEPTDNHMEAVYHDHRTTAVEVFSASALVLGGGVYLWLRDARSTSQLTAITMGLGVGSLVSGAMLYVTREPEYGGPGFIRPTYRRTGTPGIVLGGAGVALTGVGVWLYARGRHDSTAPTISLTNDGGILGWAGTF